MERDEKERERKRERMNEILRTGSLNCGGWQVRNLQGKPACSEWRREERMLRADSEGGLEAEFLYLLGISVFFH